MKKRVLLIACSFGFMAMGFAQQNFWKKTAERSGIDLRERAVMPNSFDLYKLNVSDISQQLASAPNQYTELAVKGVAVKFPNAQGKTENYIVKEAPTMHADLQKKYSTTRSYMGYKEGDTTTQITFTIDPYFGLNAIIKGQDKVSYIDTYAKDNKTYIVYDRNSVKNTSGFSCGVTESPVVPVMDDVTISKTVIDGQVRKYRAAIATTIEYTAYTAQAAGVGSGTDAEKKAAVMAAINLAVNRLNQVYMNDLSVRMELVPNNDLLIFITTDSYNPLDAGSMLGANQTVINNAIGNANYDIGHVFFQAQAGNDNGVAYLRSVCNNSIKAGGVTGSAVPVGDPFVIDYVAHEMGHQFGANHTQNNNCNRNNATSVEPGSASTIMGYAGICSPNVQNNSDAYFHAVSVREMYLHVTGSGNCSQNTPSGNTEPVVTAGPNLTIPKNTPFALTAVATDVDGDTLTYNWEQTDFGAATMPPRPTNTTGPMFRSMFATESPTRYFPRLSTVIEGYNPSINTPSNYRAWEKLSAVARTLKFSVLVRDNNPAGPQSGRADKTLTISDAAGPFNVSSQGVANIKWLVNSIQEITWEVANTNVAPVNTQNVQILLSTDGGVTFPHVIVDSTPNNGTYNYTVPATYGAVPKARIMVKAIDNVFYNVNRNDFEISTMLAVDNNVKNNNITIYPNPANHEVNVSLKNKSESAEYSIFDTTGRIVAKGSLSADGKINVQKLTNGNYILKIELRNGEKFTDKLMIKK